MSGGPLVVVGDALLDRDVDGTVERLSPDAPIPVVDEACSASRPGGAGLAAVLAARADGVPVTLITALGGDEGARELRGLLEAEGVTVVDLGLRGPTPEKVRFRADGRSLLRVDRGGDPSPVGPAGPEVHGVLESAAAVLVSDYGRGVAAEPRLRSALEALPASIPVVWDPHPRGPAPTSGVTVATPNDSEVSQLVPEPGGTGVAAVAARGDALLGQWDVAALCVTRGSRGALLVRRGMPVMAPAPVAVEGDPCGAGDRFAAALTAALVAGRDVESAVLEAVEMASAFVSAGGAGGAWAARAAAAQSRDSGDCGDERVPAVDRVRASGGTLVATGGCFDLLHAGHVRTLEAARRLGDCLVVCLNSDESVRRLKGADRPLVPAEDRAAVLEALGCVDAVVLFDEDTPQRALEGLRPDIWVKGGDYGDVELPEARAVEGWGGRCVLLPYVEGRSTTRLIGKVRERPPSSRSTSTEEAVRRVRT